MSEEPAAKQNDSSSANPSREDYKVGPGRPPKETRWRKGAPSPNPKGRPRNNSSLTPDVKRLFQDALNGKISLTRDGRRVTLAKLELGFEQLANQFAKGDRHARRDVFMFAAQLGVDLTGKAEALKEALAPNYQDILDSYVSGRQGVFGLERERVIAPTDLLDDDVAEKKK
jgi:hypothetical protein